MSRLGAFWGKSTKSHVTSVCSWDGTKEGANIPLAWPVTCSVFSKGLGMLVPVEGSEFTERVTDGFRVGLDHLYGVLSP